MMYLYLFLNIASFSIPFAYSFEKKMRFIKWYKSVFFALIVNGVFFISWDIYFTQIGVWGFNPNYYLGNKIFGLPFEELLFFLCIPYASIFTHYALIYFFKNLKLSKKTTKIITSVLLVISLVGLFVFYNRFYTFSAFLVFVLLLLYGLKYDKEILSRFYISFLVILIPFFLVNGILTGSFIMDEVVWYNNNENLGFRLFTIPVEDVFYAFDLLYLNIILIEFFKTKFKQLK
jgi:lycopene cyclase domain-containing protein